MVVTVPPVAVKVAEFELATTVTERGMVSAVELAETDTAEPPDGAVLDKVTLQVVLPPDATVDGVHCKVDTVIEGVTVTDAAADFPFRVAVSVTG